MSLFTFSIISSLLLCVLLVSFQLFLATSLTRKLYFGPNKVNLSELSAGNKLLQSSAITAYILISLGAISIIILRIYDLSIESVTIRTDGIFQTFHSFYLIFMALAYISAYSFMICRLYTTFKDSVFEIKPFIIKIHAAILIFTVLLGFTFIALIKIGNNALVLNILFGIMVFMTVFALIHLVFAFNYRLFQLVLTQKTSIFQIDSKQSMSLSERQITMLAIVRRHTLLGVLIVLLAFISIVDYIIAVTITDGKYIVLSTYPLSSGYILIFDIINMITINTASFSVYLGFTVNNKQYMKICNFCDLKCKVLCEAITETKINNGYQDTERQGTPTTPHSDSTDLQSK